MAAFSRNRVYAGVIQTCASWNGAPPQGAGWSAPVRQFIPHPSSNASFGQIDSAMTTPRLNAG
jgi:hypothetical protein